MLSQSPTANRIRYSQTPSGNRSATIKTFSPASSHRTSARSISPKAANHASQKVFSSAARDFTTLGVQPADGRLISTSDDHRGCPGAAVISYNFWQQQYGGDPSAVGKTITLDRHPFEIIGVSARGFTGTDVGSSYGVALPICAEPVFDASLIHARYALSVVASRHGPP